MVSNRERAVAMRKDGMTCVEIAAILGLSRERVCQFLRPLGISARVPASDKYRHAIIAMAKTLPQMKIAAALGIHITTVQKVLRPAVKRRWAYEKACALIGTTYPGSRLLILAIKENPKRKGFDCLVRCDCGTEKYVRLTNLKNSRTKSCGCLANENNFGRNSGLKTAREPGLSKVIDNAIAAFGGSPFTTNDIFVSIVGMGLDPPKWRISNRIAYLRGRQLEVVGHRDEGGVKLSNVYRMKS